MNAIAPNKIESDLRHKAKGIDMVERIAIDSLLEDYSEFYHEMLIRVPFENAEIEKECYLNGGRIENIIRN